MGVRYDKTREFTEMIEPKMEELKDLCLRYKIPFFAVFGIKQNPGTDLHKKSYGNVVGEGSKDDLEKVTKSNVVENTEKAYCLMPALFQELDTSDETFGKLVQVMNGAQVIPASEYNGNSGVDDPIIDSYEEDTMPTSLK